MNIQVLPGEIIEITKQGIRSIDIVDRPQNHKEAFCIFEYVYFARSDSIFEGQMVYSVRLQCGRELAREALVDADVVSSVPESGTAAAHGYARESGLHFAEVLCKNRYVGRTFIQPSTRLRKLGVAKKFGALSENVAGKRLILIDDSIVRGNTIGPIIKLLRDAGAKEVHIRIASPPLLHPCYMGINIPTREELIANKLKPDELARYVGKWIRLGILSRLQLYVVLENEQSNISTVILLSNVGADSLAYLSVGGLKRAVKFNMTADDRKTRLHCTACLTGDYPGGVPEELSW